MATRQKGRGKGPKCCLDRSDYPVLDLSALDMKPSLCACEAEIDKDTAAAAFGLSYP